MLRRFRSSESGNVSIIFALALLPLLGAIGLSIDFARLSTYRTQLQTAVDSAALALAYADKSLTDAELKTEAEKRLNENFIANDEVLSSALNVERGKDFVTVSGSAEIRTTIMNLFGYRSTSIGALGKAVWGSTRLEVVLVLDNSGSMGQQSRLVELKKASKELIDILAEASFEPGSVKIGLVPFATAVRVDPAAYKNANWIEFPSREECTGGKNPKCKTVDFDKAGWGGCLIDRAKTSDRDTHDNGYSPGNNATLSRAVETCPNNGSENEKDLGFITPLSENYSQMKSAVDDMVDGGFTNMTIGLAFGSALLTKQNPFTEAVDPSVQSDHKTEKIIIALSDGANTRSARFTGDSASTMNTRNLKACDHAKTFAKVYTILLVSGNESLLKQCATREDMYRKVDSAADLIETFRAIGKEITKLRLAV